MQGHFSEQKTYTVRPGDTLSGIACSEGCTIAELVAANSGLIADVDVLQAGWALVIPGLLVANRREPAPRGERVRSYTVRPGDTLGEVAAGWGVSVAVVCELNGIPNPDVIFVGQRLLRPVAGTVEADAGGPRRLVFSRYPVEMPPAVITGGYRQDYGGYFHRGVDFGGMAVGTAVYAPAAGTLTVHRPGDGWGDGSFGVCVVIDHPGTPWWSIYAHLDGTPRTSGERVVDGEHIGEVGFTGRVEPPGPAGAHLHWQISNHPGFPPGWEYVANPLDFVAGEDGGETRDR